VYANITKTKYSCPAFLTADLVWLKLAPLYRLSFC
jgi:hypothetical protein